MCVCECVFIRVREDVQLFAEVKIPSWETGTWTGALCQEIQSNVLPDKVWPKPMRILLSSIIIIAHSLAFIVFILTAETGILNLSCSVNLFSTSFRTGQGLFHLQHLDETFHWSVIHILAVWCWYEVDSWQYHSHISRAEVTETEQHSHCEQMWATHISGQDLFIF